MSIANENNQNLLQSFSSLVSQRRIGFVWLDDQLVTQQNFGDLGKWIPIGKNICEATPLFLGMEKELLHLQDQPESTVTIPKVGLKGENEDTLKLSIEIMWEEIENKYVVTLYNINAQSDLDHELAKQVRARRIAEDNYQSAKKKVNEQQGLLELIMDHAPSALAVFDHEMKYRFATHNWLRLYGIENQPVIGREFYELHPDTTEAMKQNHQSCQEGRHITLKEELVPVFENRQEWIRFSLRPWKKTNDAIGGIIITAELMTVLVNKGNELEQKNQELDRANQELEQFASIISHDLKAPLRSIENEIEQLKQKNIAGINTEITGITDQSTRIASMLDDLFEYSHISKKSRVQKDLNLEKLALEIMDILPNTSGFTLQLENIPTAIPLPLAPFDLILRNLVENTIKHSDQKNGNIRFAMNEQDHFWEFHFIDEGPGIPDTQNDRIFLPFHKCTENNSGNGIGLALVKKAIELHGGKISVKTPVYEHRGTQFTFTWPKQ